MAELERQKKGLTFLPDNHMVNGTKLPDAAGWSEEKRDESLNAEKDQRLVTTAPWHLRGVW